MAYIQAYSLLSNPEYTNIVHVYICLHANYLNKILFKPKVIRKGHLQEGMFQIIGNNNGRHTEKNLFHI